MVAKNTAHSQNMVLVEFCLLLTTGRLRPGFRQYARHPDRNGITGRCQRGIDSRAAQVCHYCQRTASGCGQ